MSRVQRAGGVVAAVALAGCSGDEHHETTGPTMSLEVEIGECEGGSSTEGGYEIAVEVDADDRLVVHLNDEWAICHPFPHVSLYGNGNELTLEFHDVMGSSGSDCSCRTDFTVTTEPYLPGDWFLDVVYNDEPQGELVVTVPE